ncbi:AraC family transcriptional regulator [Leptospira ainlahdjerensis]|nr:helix-turn-helix domain-containing protein [Leptospira ainlahdjerensis]
MKEILFFIFHHLVGFGGVLSIIFAFIHISKGKALKNVILFSIFISMGFFLIKGLMLLIGFGIQYSHFFSIEVFFIFLIGPSLFIYFNMLLLNEDIRKRDILVHYTPSFIFLIGFSFDTSILIFKGIDFPDLNEKFQGRYDIFYGISTLITFVYLVIILIRVLRLIKGTNIDSVWPKHMIVILCIGLMGVLVNLIIDFRFLFSLYDYFIELYILSLSILTALILYAFVISQIHPITFNIVSETFRKMSYQRSTLQNIDSDFVSNQLNKLMNEEKVFLESDLTLQKLANKLNIKSHQLSELLNNNLNKSFFAYVNQFRINESKKLLLTEKDTTIIKIAFNCGFSSLSVFNATFKKEVGIAPSQFRKKNL